MFLVIYLQNINYLYGSEVLKIIYLRIKIIFVLEIYQKYLSLKYKHRNNTNNIHNNQTYYPCYFK